MPTPMRTRHSTNDARERNIEIELNTTEPNATIQEKEESHDEFQDISLDSSENEFNSDHRTSIANDNFDVDGINTVYTVKKFDGSIYPQAEFRTQRSFSCVPRKRLRQWSENDLYLPEMRHTYRNRIIADIHRPLDDEMMSSNMERINHELASHSQQLQKISNDVQQLYKEESHEKQSPTSAKESGFDLILREIRDLRSDLTENKEQLSALREDVNMLIKKRI